ncbi:MAG TPA: hypothetical protein VGJ20_32255 [Xanthobacteraceae bacterium]|jgi:hypothetical protein
MEIWPVGWLQPLPPWLQVSLICVVFVGVTWLGIVAVHPVLRRLLHGDEPSNEAIIFNGANFGLFYAVLLGLLTIETFQGTKDVLGTIDREASNLSTLYSAADGYPDPLRAQLKGQLRDYARYVIDKDWPAHRRGVVLEGGQHRLEAIRRTVLSFEPTTKTQEVLQAEMQRYLDAMGVARQQRLSAVTAAIPRLLWYLVLIGALLTVVFVWMLHMNFISQFLLGGVTALFLGIMIFLIYSLDRPLEGAVSISPDSFTTVYDQVMKWDE